MWTRESNLWDICKVCQSFVVVSKENNFHMISFSCFYMFVMDLKFALCSKYYMSSGIYQMRSGKDKLNQQKLKSYF